MTPLSLSSPGLLVFVGVRNLRHPEQTGGPSVSSEISPVQRIRVSTPSPDALKHPTVTRQQVPSTTSVPGSLGERTVDPSTTKTNFFRCRSKVVGSPVTQRDSGVRLDVHVGVVPRDVSPGPDRAGTRRGVPVDDCRETRVSPRSSARTRNPPSVESRRSERDGAGGSHRRFRTNAKSGKLTVWKAKRNSFGLFKD